MATVGAYEAKTHLPRLLVRVVRTIGQRYQSPWNQPRSARAAAAVVRNHEGLPGSWLRLRAPRLGQPQPPPDARIAQTLATGYTFQGALLRRSVVALQDGASGEATALQSELSETQPLETAIGSVNRPEAQAETMIDSDQIFRLDSEGLPSADESSQA